LFSFELICTIVAVICSSFGQTARPKLISRAQWPHLDWNGCDDDDDGIFVIARVFNANLFCGGQSLKGPVASPHVLFSSVAAQTGESFFTLLLLNCWLAENSATLSPIAA
jgi:hypothetical protein